MQPSAASLDGLEGLERKNYQDHGRDRDEAAASPAERAGRIAGHSLKRRLLRAARAERVRRDERGAATEKPFTAGRRGP